uniref:Uncharacterized protein n=1 Tax=Ascaris lumbricoides TaxID=6252 RepID=A0A0M3HIU2_ASCLU
MIEKNSAKIISNTIKWRISMKNLQWETQLSRFMRHFSTLISSKTIGCLHLVNRYHKMIG